VSQPRRPSWLLIVFLLIGLGITYGGFSVYADAHSGTPGTAKVTECEGGGKYRPGVHCRGTWKVGEGSILDGAGVAVGAVKGAGYGDVGKTIDVRIHGRDHASKPGIGTPIMLWSIGGLISLLSLWAVFRSFRPRAPAA
jgi:hypothetical protein